MGRILRRHVGFVGLIVRGKKVEVCMPSSLIALGGSEWSPKKQYLQFLIVCFSVFQSVLDDFPKFGLFTFAGIPFFASTMQHNDVIGGYSPINQKSRFCFLQTEI